jgi:hypothetical protein
MAGDLHLRTPLSQPPPQGAHPLPGSRLIPTY